MDQQKIESLTEQIAAMNRAYWEKGISDISDFEYDQLVEELKALCPDHPLVVKICSPVVQSNGKVRHHVPMLSLDKAYTLDEIRNWVKSCGLAGDTKLTVMPKYDGISADFTNGILSTRGDGVLGENITDKLPLIKAVRLEGDSFVEIDGAFARSAISLRGELLMSTAMFNERFRPNIKSQSGTEYKTVRNSVAGIMGWAGETSAQMHQKMLDAGAYLYMVPFESWSICVTASSIQLEDHWGEILKRIQKVAELIPCDGAVIRIADRKLFESLGCTSHHPRGAIAFKFPNQQATAKLLGVEWTAGKRVLTPTALLSPTSFGGVTVRRANLHNFRNILDMDLKIGDYVTLVRSGDVIPDIISREAGEERKDITIFSCPFCDGPVLFSDPEIVCINKDCPELVAQQITASASIFKIDNLAEATVRKMIKQYKVNSLYDVFMLTRDELRKLEGFGDKSAQTMHDRLVAARKVTDVQVLASLNIPGVGESVAKLILANHHLLDLDHVPQEELQSIHGIGPERAAVIKKWFTTNISSLLKFAAILDIQYSSQEPDSRKTVCFTGKMPEKRSFYENLAEAGGLRPVNRLTSSTGILVYSEEDGRKSSKLDRAIQLGVTTMALTDWLASLEK